jgi:hypothetical protein
MIGEDFVGKLKAPVYESSMDRLDGVCFFSGRNVLESDRFQLPRLEIVEVLVVYESFYLADALRRSRTLRLNFF